MTLKERWIAALRSGEYKQHFGRWTNGNGAFCALGLAYHVEGLSSADRVSAKPFTERFGLPGDYPLYLIASWNDTDKLSFDEIADKLEAL